MNIDTGEIKLWADLTEEERASGKWIPLPNHDENGQPVSARRRNVVDDLFPKRSDAEQEAELRKALAFPPARGFDAVGKPR